MSPKKKEINKEKHLKKHLPRNLEKMSAKWRTHHWQINQKSILYIDSSRIFSVDFEFDVRSAWNLQNTLIFLTVWRIGSELGPNWVWIGSEFFSLIPYYWLLGATNRAAVAARFVASWQDHHEIHKDRKALYQNIFPPRCRCCRCWSQMRTPSPLLRHDTPLCHDTP